jgi:hypothetical protein
VRTTFLPALSIPFVLGLGSIGVWSLPRAVAQERTASRPSGDGGAIIERLRHIDATLSESAYTHVTRVNEPAGVYDFDCSGMVAWVLSRSAPGAYQALRRGVGDRRMVARDFYRHIASVRPAHPHWAWSRVERVAEAEPGDVIAWIKPEIVRSAYTGHVAFIVDRPAPVREQPGMYLVRIADASSYRHQDDSREGTGRTGFGFGTILVTADPTSDAPLAYGWVGLDSAWVFPTDIAIGRPRH